MSQSNLQKTIEIMLAFGVDNSKAGLLKKSLNDLASKFEILQKEAEQTRKDINELGKSGLSTEQLQDHLADVETQLEGVAKEAKQANGELEQLTNNTAYNIRDIGEKLNQIGGAMQNAGNALLSPIQGAISAYMEQQTAIKEAGGQMSESASQFSIAQKEMQSAYVRIGAVALEQLAPYMEDAAELLSKFADFVEQNPEVIEGIAKSGIALSVMGKFISAVGQIAMFAGVLQGMGLFASGGLLAGAIPALVAAAPAIGVLIGGAILAELVRRGLNNILGTDQSFKDIGDTWKKILILSAFESKRKERDRTGGTETDQELLALATAEVGLGEAAAEAAPPIEKTAEELAAVAAAEKKRADGLDQIAKVYKQYQAAEVEATRAFESSKAKIIEDAYRAEQDASRAHGEKVASINDSYKEKIASALASYQQQEAQSAQAYQTSRAQTMRDAGIEIQKIEEDHQKRLAELLQGHNDNMEGLAASRDALGIAKEMRSYERSRQEEEQNANGEIAQRRADIALKLNDMAQAYAAERAQRAQEFQLSMADAAKQKQADLLAERNAYAEETRKRALDRAQRLKDLETQFQEEKRKRQETMLASINELATEAGLKNKYYALQLQDVEKYMKAWRAGMTPDATGASPNATGGASPNTPPVDKGERDFIGARANGGYAGAGIYRMGERGTEFVLNANSTRAAEKMIGGNLSQDRMLAGLSRGGTSRATNNITLQQTVHFNGENSAVNRAQLRTLIHDVALEAIGQVM